MMGRATTGAKGLIVAAPRSGAGKTTVTLGLMGALARRGLAVQPFKVGPDYIDPAFHTAVAGRPSYNLDTWAMRPELIASLIAHETETSDIAIAEGVMGLFDGVAGQGQTARGATADIAVQTGWPVLLVLDVTGQAETAAAIALGCATYRPEVKIAGVILNRLASPRQLGLMSPAFERLGLPILGKLDRREAVSLPERHLGLVQACETADLAHRLNGMTDWIEEGLDIAAVIEAARPARVIHPGGGHDVGPHTSCISPPGQRIAIARDEAFSFAYPHVLRAWRAAGAEVLPFSPLADEMPDAAADAIWLPGGYPELFAGQLASASRCLGALRQAAVGSVPIHGECGGYMVLGTGLEDKAGTRHAMAGLLGLETSYAKRKLHLGYRRARLEAPSSLGPSGTVVYGHEFHYASVIATSDAPLVTATDAAGALVSEQGSRRGSVTGTFFHAIDRAAP